MKVERYDSSGAKRGTVELDAQIAPAEFSRSLIHEVIRAELSNRRQGTHKTKGRSEVSGGGKKPWRQKGTGSARQGSIRAPQWRGGGIVFGPRPHKYQIRVPEKVRKAGLRAIIGSKAAAGGIRVVEDLKVDGFRTRAIHEVLEKMGLIPHGSIAFVVDSDEAALKRSLGNIPYVRFIHARRPTAPELYYSTFVVVTESALGALKEVLAAPKREVA